MTWSRYDVKFIDTNQMRSSASTMHHFQNCAIHLFRSFVRALLSLSFILTYSRRRLNLDFPQVLPNRTSFTTFKIRNYFELCLCTKYEISMKLTSQVDRAARLKLSSKVEKLKTISIDSDFGGITLLRKRLRSASATLFRCVLVRISSPRKGNRSAGRTSPWFVETSYSKW